MRQISVIDLVKEARPSIQEELRMLRNSIDLQTAALEDLSALILGALTKGKVNKL